MRQLQLYFKLIKSKWILHNIFILNQELNMQ